MKKTYIVPEMVTAAYKTGVLMEGSLGIDSSKTVSSEDGSGGWTRQQIWIDEEE